MRYWRIAMASVCLALVACASPAERLRLAPDASNGMVLIESDYSSGAWVTISKYDSAAQKLIPRQGALLFPVSVPGPMPHAVYMKALAPGHYVILQVQQIGGGSNGNAIVCLKQ